MSLFDYDVTIHPNTGLPVRMGVVHAQHGGDAVIDAARLIARHAPTLDPDARVYVTRVGTIEDELSGSDTTVRTIGMRLQCQVFLIEGNIPDKSLPSGKKPVRYLVSDIGAERATRRAWTASGHRLIDAVSQTATLQQARDAGLSDEQAIEI